MDHNQYAALATARRADLLADAAHRQVLVAARAQSRAVRLSRRATRLESRATRLQERAGSLLATPTAARA